jgi:acyl carrier protein
MELKDFIENFAEQFDDTEACELNADTRYKELEEWSSLIALSVIAMVDEEYDVAIKGDDIRNSETIQDLFEIVKTKAE